MDHDNIGEIATQLGTVLGSAVTTFWAWKQSRSTRATKQTRRMFWAAVFTVLVAATSIIVYGFTKEDPFPHRRMVLRLAETARKLVVDADDEAKRDRYWEDFGDRAFSSIFTISTPNVSASPSEETPQAGPPPVTQTTVFAKVVPAHKQTMLNGLDKIQSLAAAFENVYPEASPDLVPLCDRIDKFRVVVLDALDDKKFTQGRLMKDLKSDYLKILEELKKDLDIIIKTYESYGNV